MFSLDAIPIVYLLYKYFCICIILFGMHFQLLGEEYVIVDECFRYVMRSFSPADEI